MLQLQHQALSTTTTTQTPVLMTDVMRNQPDANIPEVWTGPAPDNTNALCTSFKVAGQAPATSMSVQVKINHNYVGDVVIWIQKGPDANPTFSVLKDGPDRNNQFRDLVADYPLTFITSASKSQSVMQDTAVSGNDICAADASACSFKPADPLNHQGSVNLDKLALNPNDNWKLCVADDDALVTGDLVDFKLWMPAYDPLNSSLNHGEIISGVQGDPHIHSLRGVHYTLLKADSQSVGSNKRLSHKT